MEVIALLEDLLGRRLEVAHVATRAGDVPHSQAANERLIELFPDIEPVSLEVGLGRHDRLVPAAERLGDAPVNHRADAPAETHAGHTGGQNTSTDAKLSDGQSGRPQGTPPTDMASGATSMEPTEIRFSAPDIGELEVEAATGALLSSWITTGEECRTLERELEEYLGVEHVVAVSSCTAALEIAVAALGLPCGARVGIPTWTFVSTAISAYHRGLQPVLLDVEPSTFNLSPDALEGRSSTDPGLDAVIGVHFAGTPLSEEIHQLCAAAGVPLIEDAAHALGASDHRGMVAGQGTAGCCYSFYATKNLTSAEGGALATDDAELARFAQSFRLHGLSRDAWARYTPGAKTGGYDLLGDGLKANLPDVLAAIARAQLARFEGLQARRRELSSAVPGSARGASTEIRVVPTSGPMGSADHLMMVLLPESVEREVVQKQLSSEGIGTSVHFRPLHTFDWFGDHGLHPRPRRCAGGRRPRRPGAQPALPHPAHRRGRGPSVRSARPSRHRLNHGASVQMAPGPHPHRPGRSPPRCRC